MFNLGYYPRLERLAKSSPDLRCTLGRVFRFYQDQKRLSGRPVIQHCLETAELASQYTTESCYLMVAIYHDLREDLGLPFRNLKIISGCYGEKVAGMVTILSKRADLKNKNDRNREYMARIANAIEKDPWVGIIKLSDRRSNLTDIQSLPAGKRREIAAQTLHFYVPIALKLGLVGLANSMKELSLPYALPYSVGAQELDPAITQQILV
jgi:GTP pyrophosphokinase